MEAPFSHGAKQDSQNTVDVGQFFRTREVCDARGRSLAPCCKELTKPRPIQGFRMMRNILETTTCAPIPDVFVSEDQVLIFIDLKTSSPLRGTARARTSRGVTQ